MADIYSVGLALDTTQLQRGAQQSRTILQHIIQQESQLERQSQQTTRALQTQGREAATAAARLREQARAAREAKDVKLAESLTAQARALSQQAREARASAAATREQARASREAATAAKAQQASMGGGLGGAARGLLTGGVGGGVTGALGGLVGGVAVTGLLAAGNALRTLTSNATNTATEMLNLHNRMTTTAGSAAGGAREFQHVASLANRLGVDIVGLAGNYASFTAAIKGTTLEGEKGRQAFEQISAGLARMGLSSETTHRALAALQQMVSKGTVAAEELRGQWGEAVPGGFQIAARAMGVTTSELSKLSEQGQIAGTTLVEKLGGQMAREAGPSLERVGAGSTRLNNTLKEVSVTVAGPFVSAWDKAANSLAAVIGRLFNTQGALDAMRKELARTTDSAIDDVNRLSAAQLRAAQSAGTQGLGRPGGGGGVQAQRAIIQREAERARLGEEMLGAEEALFGAGRLGTFDPIKSQTALHDATKKTAESFEAYRASLSRTLDATGRLSAELAFLRKQQGDQMEALEKLTGADKAHRSIIEEHVRATDKDISVREKRLETLKDEEKATQRLTTQANALAEREIELQLRYQAKNIALKEGTEAGEAYEDRTNTMTEAEKAAEAQHLRRSSAINAENRSLERAAKLTKEWQDILTDLEEQHAKANLSEEQYLEKRLTALGAPPAKIEEALLHQRGIKTEEDKNAIQRQARADNKAMRRDLSEDTLIAERALQDNLSLEEARVQVQMEMIANGDADLAQLREKYAIAEATLALYKAQAGLGTTGLPAEMAIQSFRDRGHTQGVVEGQAGPIEQAMQRVNEATSRFDTTLIKTREDLFSLGGPEAVQLFDDLTIKRFGAATEGLYEFEEGLYSVREAALDMSATVIDALGEMATEGKKSFKDLAQSVIQDLLRILQQKFLQPQLAKWGELAISAGLKILGGIGGASVPSAPMAGLGGSADLGLGADFGVIFPQAVGGPLRSGVTLVGEAGPEAVVSRGGRSVVFPTSHPISRIAVRRGLPGRQYGGPLPSALMGGTGSEASTATMTSTSGQGRGITQNFYISTPDAQSFLKSKGEISRQMMAAFRSTQRS